MRASLQPSARRRTASSSLLAAVQVTVAQIARGLDRGAPVHAAAIQPGHFAGKTIQIHGARPLDVFEIPGLAFDNHPADAGEIRMIFQECDGGAEKLLMQQHVAVDQTNIVAGAVLVAELHACAAGSVGDVGETDDLDRIIRGDRNGSVGRGAVGQNDLAAHSFERGDCAFDRGRDMALLVERLDDDADVWTCAEHGAAPI